MYKSLFLLLFISIVGCADTSKKEVTFIVDVPRNTPKDRSIYISGDFENWTGGQDKYKLSALKNRFFITLPYQDDAAHFKFTLGSWETVELDENGHAIENRNYNFSKNKDTLFLKIKNWTNHTSSKKPSTASSNVSILDENFKIPQLNRERRIWVYLPPDYENSTASYPVVYMHDGQNIFDTSTAYAGEWNVDETLNKLYKKIGLGLIVIGIDNGNSKRLDEYSPWKNKKYGGGEGEAYADFIVNTLKPIVDQKFRTLSNKENTGIIGSSMGGLISYYATLKYADVFGKSGVFSPSFWFSDKSFDFAKTNGNLKETKLFFLAGEKEDGRLAFKEISRNR